MREAIARAAFERQGEDVRVGGGFMEVRVISIGFEGGEGGRRRGEVIIWESKMRWLTYEYRSKIWRSWRRSWCLIFDGTTK